MLGSLISSGLSFLAGSSAADKQAKLQKEFAQNALQWKAADAEKAGISKIFAMGAPTTSYSPVSVGGTDFSNLGNSLDKAMGQGGTGSTTTGKLSGASAAIASAQLDGLKLDNDIKRADLAAKLNVATQPGTGGVLDRDVVQGPNGVTLKKEIAPGGHLPQKSYGVSPEVDLYRTHSGYAPQIPKDLQEAFESDALSRWQWNLRNKLAPYYYDSAKSPPYPASSGSYWTYDPLAGEYRQIKRGGDRSGNRQEMWEYLNSRLRR